MKQALTSDNETLIATINTKDKIILGLERQLEESEQQRIELLNSRTITISQGTSKKIYMNDLILQSFFEPGDAGRGFSIYNNRIYITDNFLYETGKNNLEIAISSTDTVSIELTQNGNDEYWLFEPATNFHGTKIISYAVFNNYNTVESNYQTYSIKFDVLYKGNNAPETVPDISGFSTEEDTPFTFTAAELLAGITDSDGDSLTISQITSPKGTITYHDATETYTFTPETNFNGNTTIDYIIDDGNGGLLPISKQVYVTAVNDPPEEVVAENTLPNIMEDTELQFSEAQLLVGIVDIVDGMKLHRRGWVSLSPKVRVRSQAIELSVGLLPQLLIIMEK